MFYWVINVYHNFQLSW